MIKNITLAWPDTNIDTEYNLKAVEGDSIILNVTIDNIDLHDYKIRGELYSSFNSIKVANLLSGGSDDDIVALDSESGTSAFKLTIAPGLTEEFAKFSILEIEIEDTDGNIFTILQQRFIINEEKIDWTNPS